MTLAEGRDKAGVIVGILKLSPLTSRDKICLWQICDSPLLLGYAQMSPLHPRRSGCVPEVYIQPYSQSCGCSTNLRQHASRITADSAAPLNFTNWNTQTSAFPLEQGLTKTLSLQAMVTMKSKAVLTVHAVAGRCSPRASWLTLIICPRHLSSWS